MKLDDLIVGKQYLVFGKKKYYAGETKGLNATHYLFSNTLDNSFCATTLVADEVKSDVTAIVDFKTLKYGEEYSEEEKTMQDQFKLKDSDVEPLKKCKKPFRKIMKLREQDILEFLSEQGYNTEGYKLGGFQVTEADVYITLNLAEADNEKTKTN